MPSNPDRPFDHDTLKLPAVFVPEDARHQVSQADLTATLGYDAVEIPAVFVPEGGKPPGYGYERIGLAEFRPDDEGNAARRVYTSWQSSSQSSSQSPEDSAAVPTLPRTRFRFGAALGGDRSPGPPPNPTVSSGRPAPAAAGRAAGLAAWRSMADPVSVWRQSVAAPGPAQGGQGSVVTAAATVAADPAAPSGHIGAVRDQGPAPGPPPPHAGTTAPDKAPGDAERKLEDARVKAMLRLIRSAENQDDGNNAADYHKSVGDGPGSSGSIVSLDHYPDRRVRLKISGRETESSASGAYQIMEQTWRGAVASLAAEGVSVGDFSAPSQDRVAEQIIQEHHALDLVRAGQIEQAVALLRGTWVSLPGGVEQAPGLDRAEARRRFDRYLAADAAP